MEIYIRKATMEDYPALCDLFDEIDTLHREHLPHLFQKPEIPARDQAHFSEQISDENTGLWVAEVDGNLVGLIHAILKEPPAVSLFVPRTYVSIESVGVKSEFQHQGIAKELMGNMQNWAIEKGATSIELNVYEFNQSAISFYERLGYQTFSRKMSIVSKKDKTDD